MYKCHRWSPSAALFFYLPSISYRLTMGLHENSPPCSVSCQIYGSSKTSLGQKHASQIKSYYGTLSARPDRSFSIRYEKSPEAPALFNILKEGMTINCLHSEYITASKSRETEEDKQRPAPTTKANTPKPRNNEVLLQARYDVIVISSPGGASRYFIWRNLKVRPDFLIAFHSNHLPGMHGFRDNEV